MELQKIDGNCSLYSLKGNESAAKRGYFKKELEQELKLDYTNNGSYIMLVTNRYERFSFLRKYFISKKTYLYDSFRITETYKKYGFKKIGSYKINTVIMVAKVDDILKALYA